MLVLSRKVGEKIVIGDNITLVVNKVVGNRVSLGIEAPRDVRIVRGELTDAVRAFDGPPVPPAPVILDGPTFQMNMAPVLHRAR